MKTKLQLFALVALMMTGTAQAQGTHLEVVGSSAMPLGAPPGELERFAPGRVVAHEGGVAVYRDAGKYAEFKQGFEAAKSSAAGVVRADPRGQRPPSASKDLAQLRLAFVPKQVDAGHELITASPAGMLTDSGWSGLERFIAIPGVGVYKLTEFDLAKTGGRFFLASDAVNTYIDNTPAAAKFFVDDEGRRVEDVVWVSAGRFRQLTFVPGSTVAPDGKPGRLPAFATAIGIAQKLRDH